MSRKMDDHPLTRFKQDLIQATELDKTILDELISKFILSPDDREEITNAPSQPGRNKALLDCLISKPYNTFGLLGLLLEEIGKDNEDVQRIVQQMKDMDPTRFEQKSLDVIDLPKKEQDLEEWSRKHMKKAQLQKNYRSIVENVDCTGSLCDILVVNKVITMEEREKLCAEGLSRNESCRRMLGMLVRKDCSGFLEALRTDPAYIELADSIKHTTVTETEMRLMKLGEICFQRNVQDEQDEIRPEETNFLRIYLLCTNLATNAVRILFDNHVPSVDLHRHLGTHESVIKGKWNCFPKQLKVLFPGEICFQRNVQDEQDEIRPEETNFLRIYLLCTNLATNAVRILFDNHVPSVDLHRHLGTHESVIKGKWNCFPKQLKVLFPDIPLLPQSIHFDFSLLYKLVRNTLRISAPTQGWGKEPLVNDTSVADDVERIRKFRNSLAHNEQTLFSESDFQKIWTELSQAIHRLSNGALDEEVDDLKNKRLDQNLRIKKVDIMKFRREVEDLKQEFDDIKTRVENLEARSVQDHIPPNIREQIKKTLEQWIEEDKKCVHTRAADHVLKVVQEENCVTITGPSGCGKTFTARHTALILKTEGYDIIPIYTPSKLEDYYKPGRKTCFIVDDICGKFTASIQQVDTWKQFLPVIENIIKDKSCKIIVSCRHQVFYDGAFKSLTPFICCECDLVSTKNCLTLSEKSNMIKQYTDVNISGGEIAESLDCIGSLLPLLCSLYKVDSGKPIMDFLQNPFDHIKGELDALFHQEGDDGKYKICALALIVLFNNKLEDKWLQGKVTDQQSQVTDQQVTDQQRHLFSEQKDLFGELCNACSLPSGLSKKTIHTALKTLLNSFVQKENTSYKAVHDKIFDFLVWYFGQNIIDCLIDHGNAELLYERMRYNIENSDASKNNGIFDKSEDMKFIIDIPEEYLTKYIVRLVEQWSDGKVVKVFGNLNMKNQLFRKEFLSYLKQLDIPKQIDLVTRRDEENYSKWYFDRKGSKPLLESCYHGYKDFTEWMLSLKVDINLSDDNKKTALYWTCKNNNIEMVRKVLERNPDVNLTDTLGGSPLHLACNNDNLAMVKILLEKNPDVNQTDWKGLSPLYLACENNNLDMVKILLEKNPDVNQTDRIGRSLLYLACENNNLDMVKILLEKNPDVNQTDKYRQTRRHLACCNNNPGMEKMLLERNPDVNQTDRIGRSPLHLACENNNLDMVKMLLEKNPDVNQTDEKRLSPLHLACENNNLDMAKILLEKNANVNQTDMFRQTPLHFACGNNNPDMVKILLERNPDVNQTDEIGRSPLHWVCIKDNIDMLKMFLENNSDVNKSDGDAWSPLYWACRNNNIDMVKMLLEKNPDVNRTGGWGKSPLHLACENDNLDMVKVLLERNPDVNLTDRDGKSPLYLACENNNLNMVKLLLEKNPDVNLTDTWGRSSLYWACKKNNLDMVRILLEKNPDVNQTDDEGRSPLYLACKKNNLDMVRILLEKNPDVSQTDEKGRSPLYMACKNNNLDMVKVLLEKNPNVNKSDMYRQTPLLYACCNNNPEMVKMLLENNSDVNQTEENGLSPLHLACVYDNLDMVKILLAKNPDVNQTDRIGRSSLYLACKNDNLDMVKILLEKNPDVNQTDWLGRSPLYLACKNDNLDMVRMLLEKNLNVDKTDWYGRSPLYLACEKNNLDMVRILLEKNPDVSHIGKNGRSPLDLANENGNVDIVSMLLEKA